jgi:hypothetical protein
MNLWGIITVVAVTLGAIGGILFLLFGLLSVMLDDNDNLEHLKDD